MDEDYRDDAEAADELREEPGVPDDPEVPEADALEQTRDVRPASDDLPSEVGDRPEADALEQARAIDEDDEDRR